MFKVKWEKVKHAPIPDYNSTDGRWRIFRSTHRGWCLQDCQSPSHPDPILYADTMAQAKSEAIYQTALDDFNATLARTAPADIEKARTGCGLRAACFACHYVKPEKDQVLYTRIYEIFWDYYHKQEEK